MTPSQKKAVRKHRQRQTKNGLIRLELNVPKQDRDILRSVATELRKGGVNADRLRFILESYVGGEELLDFKKYLELAPIEGLDLERNKDATSRDIDF